MSTTTPKRKRGQHAKRHPWSKMGVVPANEAWNRWMSTKAGEGVFVEDGETWRMFLAFAAGYRAGLAKR